ncbi:helical backbone metal receptor [Candidatus Poriferisodalis sp.]|uniref:helical backbone metal receptor n=1 Tax=Candidatus Poriferisodalis sp. TaxID=3101277 RepID=UPI003B01EE0E
MRVISLVPSVTETLSAWDTDPIACTRYCERPDLAHIGGTKNPDIEAIAELQPDLVVADREENRKEDHDALIARGIEVEALHIVSLDHVAPQLARLARRIGVDWQPEPLPGRTELPPLHRPGGGEGKQPVRVFVPIWRRPYMTVGAATYGVSLLEYCGVQVAFADRPETYPTLSEEDLRSEPIDLVLAPTEPYEWHRRHFDELTAIGPAHLIDGQDLFWWGTRTPAAVTRVAQTIAGALA